MQQFDVQGSSRATVSRDIASVLGTPTSFGDLIQEVAVPRIGGGVHMFEYVQPQALMELLLRLSPSYNTALAECLAAKPSSRNRPWSISFFADKATPGNLLKVVNERAAMCMYWSWEEYGVERLSRTHCWHIAGIVRASHLKEIKGGLSMIACKFLEAFFNAHSFAEGVLFVVNGSRVPIYGRVGTLLFDEEALHGAIGSKGASGSKPCALCANLVSRRSELAAVDVRLKCVDALTWDDLDRHTDATMRALLDHLEAQSSLVPRAEFNRLCTSLGFAHVEGGLLQSRVLRPHMSPTRALLYDYMHVVLVCGIFQHEMWLFLWYFVEHTPWHVINTNIERWKLPCAWSSGKPRGMFSESRRKSCYSGGTFKCGASEALSFYEAFRHLIRTSWSDCPHHAQLTSLRAMFRVVDGFQVMQAGGRPSNFTACVRSYIDAYLIAYSGMERHGVRPMFKHHMLLHLGYLVDHHRERLQTAFVHERKHRDFKNRGSQQDSDVNWNRCVMMSLLCVDVNAIVDGTCLRIGVHVLDAQRSPAMEAMLGCQPCSVSRRASKYGLILSADDIVFVQRGGDPHLQVYAIQCAVDHPGEGPCLYCIRYERVGADEWARVDGLPELIGVHSVLAPAVWRPLDAGGRLEVLLPGLLAYGLPNAV